MQQSFFNLDFGSEFPSLSGTPQTHHQNPGQALWANVSQRAAQQNTAPQRAQQLHSNTTQTTSNQTPSQPPSQSQQQHSQQQDMFPSGAQFASGLEDYRHSNQNPISQQAGSVQPQTGSIDEFPPLGRNAVGDVTQDRRGSLMQSVGLNGFGSAPGFGGMRPRNAVTDLLGNQDHGSRMISPGPLDAGGLSASRSPLDPNRTTQNGLTDDDRPDTNSMRLPQNGTSNDPNVTTLQNLRTDSIPDQRTLGSSQSPPQLPRSLPPGGLNGGLGGDAPVSPSGHQNTDQQVLSQMSESERYSLPGLFAMMRNESQDIQSLATGQDLTTLGLDLNSPEPLCDNFISPFAESNSRPLEPDFTIPACYKVANVCPIQTKVSSFSDETLFYIFYNMTRDIMQEIVAAELSNRNWRWHKKEQIWLSPDQSMGPPVPCGLEAERGVYIYWDAKQWKRSKAQLIIQIADLDNRYVRTIP
ncbi:MAG: hypothetical protein M1834_003916 [Cirrosporium novae-zelandiae]|nr:MAG: hypothetical protein M1834_003916 [Cirrosporium novae-zelandiae]